MPCLFFKGWPPGTYFNREATRALYDEVAVAVGFDISRVEVHVDDREWTILKPDGMTHQAQDVHVIVMWTERPLVVKELVATAIHKFCEAHRLESDITFCDFPLGSFFVNGDLFGPRPQDTKPL
jgi:hypothetical protein